MYRFLLMYLGVYGSMCAYTCRRFQVGSGLSWRAWWPGYLLFAALLLAPILVHRLRAGGVVDLTRIVSFAAFIGMAWVFWWSCTFLSLDLWNLICRVPAGLTGRLTVSSRAMAWTALTLSTAGSLWGLVEARMVHVHEVVVTTPAIPRSMPPVRVLLISDLHLGATSVLPVIAKVAALARAAHPDLLVSVGDLLDATGPEVEPLLSRFRDLEPPFGKYAVLGNHEAYAGAGRALDRLEQAGFRVLRQERVSPVPGIDLVGVDDPAVNAGGHGALPGEADLLQRRPRDHRFTLLLKHQPRVSAAAQGGADLQLSGHSHNGQIFPFGWVVRLFYPYAHGQLLRVGDTLTLYASPGTGTWGPPFRVFARPELTLFVLRGR